jgi:peptidoglycan hydrolase-like protein with peptidoglycan-binding domain
MRTAKPGGFIVAAAIILAACGGDATVETTTTSTIAATTSSTSTTTTVPATTSSTTTVPTVGATSTMYVVQADLTALGYFDGVIDGIAGEITTAAIASFQSDVGIEADGEFGPLTDGEMYPLLQKDPDYVEGVQEALTELELYTGPIDGDYGPGTRAAVEKLQASCELEETGDLDIATRLCLFQP